MTSQKVSTVNIINDGNFTHNKLKVNSFKIKRKDIMQKKQASMNDKELQSFLENMNDSMTSGSMSDGNDNDNDNEEKEEMLEECVDYVITCSKSNVYLVNSKTFEIIDRIENFMMSCDSPFNTSLLYFYFYFCFYFFYFFFIVFFFFVFLGFDCDLFVLSFLEMKC